MQISGGTKMSGTKPFKIERALVMEAYVKAKAKDGSGGIDGMSWEEFDKDYKNHLYQLWNQMSSGSYFPAPLREVAIPKDEKGDRMLSIPTLRDRIAQTMVKELLEQELEKIFDDDSYGYRPGRSQHHAVAKARQRCWSYDWVVDLDIQQCFDSIPHDKLLKAVSKHTQCSWMLLYIERWLKAPIAHKDGSLTERKQGVAQGSPIGPLLVNLYLHYAIDVWMRKHSWACAFERFSDDMIIHCRSVYQGRAVRGKLKERLKQCGLQLHPKKTRIVYCKDSNRLGTYENISFDFLGFTFMPRQAQHGERKESFTNWLPGVSRKAKRKMKEQMDSWSILLHPWSELKEIAEKINPVVRGWINYYGRFYKTALKDYLQVINEKLLAWSKRKFKRFKQVYTAPIRWLKKVYLTSPDLFEHWKFGVKPGVGR